MNVLVCGGLGFAGQYVVWKLLKDRHNVTILVRSKGSYSIEQRITNMIHDNSRVNNYFRISNENFDNLTYLEGDISENNLGICWDEYQEFLKAPIDEIYNLAACLKYENEYRDQLFKINVEGTKRLLELSSHFNARYIHVSTAYIADKNHRNFIPIKEEFCYSNNYSNAYIESKSCAEILIKNYMRKNDLDYLIFRFPTITGDSKTGFTNSVYAFYEYVAALSYLKSKICIKEKIRVSALPDGNINLLPVDIVIKNMLRICTKKAVYTNRIFNLTDNCPISLSKLCDILGKVFALNIVTDNIFDINKDGTHVEKLLSKLTKYNSSFAQKDFTFDCQNAERALGYPVASEWEKSHEYFVRLKEGYECFCSTQLTTLEN